MPKKRPPNEVWFGIIRPIIWNRDSKKCTKCGIPTTLENCHIDHIISGKSGSNRLNNLRTLCPQCHILRADKNHRGMISSGLKRGIIPPNWRELVWEEEKLKQ